MPNDNNAPRRTVSPRVLIAVGAVLFVLIAAAAIVLLPAMRQAPATATVRIPRDATMQQLADSLDARFGPDYAAAVLRLLKWQHMDPAARNGAYEIAQGTSALRAARRLAKGGQTPVRITINGFRDRSLMLARIAAKLEMDAADLDRALSDPKFLQAYGLTPDQALALFVDDTYEVWWNTTPQQLLEKIGDNYRRIWDDRRTAQATALGLSPAEVMIVCSIADEETNKADEKGRIGRLYINRLQRGMRLQADPTIRFALGDFSIRRVRADHLNVNSPYNTYRNPGLPPGPIRTTSLATIDAVLGSAPSTDIYMCAREDFSGYHNFAPDFATHQANARRYRQALDSRGIK